jgi:hypothetical protein
MPRIPEFFRTLEKIGKLHEAKNQDYAKESDPFSNFRVTEYILRLFPRDEDKAFVWPIATKLARLSVLLSQNEKPNFESIEDSFDDIATYVILWKCDVMRAMQMRQAQSNVTEDAELQAVRKNLSEFVITLSEKQAKRLYALATNLLQPESPDSPNAPSVGRLNYAGTGDERKPSGLSNLYDAQLRTTTADERIRSAVDRDRKQDPR